MFQSQVIGRNEIRYEQITRTMMQFILDMFILPITLSMIIHIKGRIA